MKLLDIFIMVKPVLWLGAGLALPYLNKQLDRLLKSKQYKLAESVYSRLDPQLIQQFGGKIGFLELISESVKACSDRQLDYQELQTITKLVVREFKLVKALRK